MKDIEHLLEEIEITLDTMWEWNRDEFLEEIQECLGVKSLNTHGLPFNGTTYELFREVDFNGIKLKETIGHLKYVHAIYGGGCNVYLYDNSVSGGSSLNGRECHKYIYEKVFKKR